MEAMLHSQLLCLLVSPGKQAVVQAPYLHRGIDGIGIGQMLRIQIGDGCIGGRGVALEGRTLDDPHDLVGPLMDVRQSLSLFVSIVFGKLRPVSVQDRHLFRPLRKKPGHGPAAGADLEKDVIFSERIPLQQVFPHI